MRLRPDLMLLPLDDEAIAFSEGAQCLVGLNASAALLVQELQQGARAAELARALASRGVAAPDAAERWIGATLEALGSHGLLADVPGQTVHAKPLDDAEEAEEARQAAAVLPYEPFEPAAQQHYRLLETCALVRFGSRAQVRLVNSVIGHLATESSAKPSIVLDLRAELQPGPNIRTDVYRDEAPIACAPRLSRLAPIVKAAFWQSAINAHDFFFYIHAGVVGTGASCILLPAAAGSGKSSLTAALVHHGFRYFSDEVALIAPGTFEIPPMPLAMGIKSTGWDLMARYHPDILSLPVHMRNDGKVLRYVPPPAGAAKQVPAPVSHIIFPRYVADAPTRLERVDRSAALGRLMDECLALRRRLDPANVGDLVRWIAGIDCHELTFSSLDEAVDLVAEATAFDSSLSFTLR